MQKRKPTHKKKTTKESAILAARYSDAVIIEVFGLGNMNNSYIFTEFISLMLEKGYRKFIINLGNCTGMDSTFMGSLLGIALKLHDLGDGWTSIVNASESNIRLLSMLGVTHFVKVQETQIPMESIEMERLPDQEVSKIERLELIHKAHKNLISVDERNKKQFGAFLEMLTKEIEKGAE